MLKPKNRILYKAVPLFVPRQLNRIGYSNKLSQYDEESCSGKTIILFKLNKQPLRTVPEGVKGG